jgi:hypothetical protein
MLLRANFHRVSACWRVGCYRGAEIRCLIFAAPRPLQAPQELIRLSVRMWGDDPPLQMIVLSAA